MPTDQQPHSAQPRSRRRGPKRAKQSPPDVGAAGDTVHLQDPRDIRALAHPARMAIIDALASGDELTATECAVLTGLSPSATAYHLKLLQRYAFAEPAPSRGDGRERPWRATSGVAHFDLDPSTPAGAAATAAVAGAYFDRSRVIAEGFIATARDEPPEWQEAAALRNIDLWLSVDEVVEITAAFAAAVAPYRDRTLRNRPGKTRRVRVMTMVSPHHRP